MLARPRPPAAHLAQSPPFRSNKSLVSLLTLSSFFISFFILDLFIPFFFIFLSLFFLSLCTLSIQFQFQFKWLYWHYCTQYNVAKACEHKTHFIFFSLSCSFFGFLFVLPHLFIYLFIFKLNFSCCLEVMAGMFLYFP